MNHDSATRGPTKHRKAQIEQRTTGAFGSQVTVVIPPGEVTCPVDRLLVQLTLAMSRRSIGFGPSRRGPVGYAPVLGLPLRLERGWISWPPATRRAPSLQG